MSQAPAPRIALSGPPGLAARFLPLLREGVTLYAPRGLTLRRFMEQVLGMAPGYVAERVLTVFLNASPVDDIDASHIRDGAELALGAAMPGLAGIAMRRGSPIKAFREAIEARPDTDSAAAGDTRVLVKLFNLVADEAGPEVLRRGVEIQAARLAEFLGALACPLRQEVREIAADGLPVSREALVFALSAGPRRNVILSVEEA